MTTFLVNTYHSTDKESCQVFLRQVFCIGIWGSHEAETVRFLFRSCRRRKDGRLVFTETGRSPVLQQLRRKIRQRRVLRFLRPFRKTAEALAGPLGGFARDAGLSERKKGRRRFCRMDLRSGPSLGACARFYKKSLNCVRRARRGNEDFFRHRSRFGRKSGSDASVPGEPHGAMGTAEREQNAESIFPSGRL